MPNVDVDRTKAKALALEMKSKLGRVPTPQELAEEYNKKYGARR